jgi:hypothetical protein
MAPLMQALPATWTVMRTELLAFAGFLDELSRADETPD